MNPKRRDMDLLLAWYRKQAHYKTALAEFEAEKDLRNRRAAAMTLRESEWLGLPPAEQAHVLKKIKEEIEKEVK